MMIKDHTAGPRAARGRVHRCPSTASSVSNILRSDLTGKERCSPDTAQQERQCPPEARPKVMKRRRMGRLSGATIVRRLGARTRNTASSVCWAHILRRSGISPPEDLASRHAWPSCPACTGAGSGGDRGSMKKRRINCAARYLRCVREIRPNIQTFRARKIHDQAGRRCLRGSVPGSCWIRADSVNQQGAERGLREYVVQGRYARSIRSKNTMRWRGNLFSCDGSGHVASSAIVHLLRDRKIRLDGANTYGWRSAIRFAQFHFQLPLPAHQLVQLLLFDVRYVV